jgi:hypothetical protein
MATTASYLKPQKTSTDKTDNLAKPDILEVIGQRVELRRYGREYVGLCLFHNDRHPSLYVNPDKQVFLCRSCGERGDVFDFIQKLDGLNFREACAALGISSGDRPRSPMITPLRRAAGELAVTWAIEQRQKYNAMIAEWLELRDAADSVNLFDVAEILDRELILLRGFYDSLNYPSGVASLLALRESIESITACAEVSL